MRLSSLLKVFVACLFALSTGHIAAGFRSDDARPQTKQLSGPAAEFLTGDMREAAAAEVGLRSRSAMTPVTFQKTRNGSLQWNGQVAVDGEFFNMMVFANEEWNITLRAPGSRNAVNIEELASEFRQTSYGMAGNEFPGFYYALEGMRTGLYNVTITADNAGLTGTDVDGFLLTSTTGPYRLYSYTADRNHLVGEEIGFVAYGFNQDNFADGSTPFAGASMISEASLRVTLPNGDTRSYKLADDGLNNDGAAGDGVFGGGLTAEEIGNYKVHLIAKGQSPDGAPFIRTSEHVVPVMAPEITLADGVAETAVLNEKRMEVRLPVETFAGAPDKYNVFAQVWGSKNGEMVPVTWIGGIVYLEDNALTLGLDGRWVSLSGAQAPFELRKIRIKNTDNHIAYVEQDALALNVNRLPAAAFRSVKKIDEEMLMGPRPEAIETTDNASGSRLLLVHGYCSGPMWAGVAGQFSNASVFADYDQNRSHDQFAGLIKNYGANWNSFGIVAHSQGGAAGLHLYTYYWSGLDNASGNRLIQSVGTPYQGTALAGNLAALGEIFGIQCGYINDLTYNGASSWLSNIPSWARAKVHYYTTSFNTRWWAYDYCHIATDLFLSDPDDGTTEKSKGQLSGGNNRGHKKGWCHTASMRDPAQHTDSSRNSDMNNNAAR